MTRCEELSDRMPEVSAGEARWTAAEDRHLAACAECTAEWALLGRTRALGDPAADGLDADAIAAAVLLRLRGEGAVAAAAPAPRRRFLSFAGLAAAAVLALALWSSRPTVSPAPVPTPAAGAGGLPLRSAHFIPLPELDSLGAPELQAVLDGFDAPLTEGSTLDAPTLGDLDDHELERVLRSWEG
jgi:hypothetical protein